MWVAKKRKLLLKGPHFSHHGQQIGTDCCYFFYHSQSPILHSEMIHCVADDGSIIILDPMRASL